MYKILLVAILCAIVYSQTCPNYFGSTDLAVLGYSTVTSTGQSVVTGSVGVYPGTSITGFPPSITLPTSNNLHIADSTAQTGQAVALALYNYATSRACTTVYDSGHDIGSATLAPGVYCFSGSAFITGQLILDGQSNSSATWIFVTVSTLTTASSSSVIQTNGGLPCQVLWAIGSSATLGTSTSMIGSIVALASISSTRGTTSRGRLWALNGAVTLDTSTATINVGNTTTTCQSTVFNTTNFLLPTLNDIVINRTQSFVCQNCNVTTVSGNVTTSTISSCALSNVDTHTIAPDCVNVIQTGIGYVLYTYPPQSTENCSSVCKICNFTNNPTTCVFECIPNHWIPPTIVTVIHNITNDLWFWLVAIILIGIVLYVLWSNRYYFEDTDTYPYQKVKGGKKRSKMEIA